MISPQDTFLKSCASSDILSLFEKGHEIDIDDAANLGIDLTRFDDHRGMGWGSSTAHDKYRHQLENPYSVK